MKARTNVSIDKTLLDASKAKNIVISALLEKALKDEIKRIEEEDWKKENFESASKYNDFIEENGVFSEDLRTF